MLRVIVLTCALLVISCRAAAATPIAPGMFLEFGFTDAGVAASGCFPNDPAGIFCIPSSGTPTAFLPAPPWTFTAGAGGATLTVTDAFESGDRFEIFDFGASIGLTSAPAVLGVDCGDDPVVCLGTAGISSGAFGLAAGPHAITIVATLSPGGLGAAYLLIDGATATVPEPTSLLLLLGGGAVLTVRAARRRFI